MRRQQLNDKEYFFVYGTLMSGFGNNVLLQDEEKIGKAITKEKYIMKGSGIPYVFKRESQDNILGELYLVKKTSIYSLDRLEGDPDWYCREEIKVICNNEEYTAWIYFMQENYNNNNLTIINNGDYHTFKTNSQKSFI
jgi:gamma-glutamylaminecyclotransferase